MSTLTLKLFSDSNISKAAVSLVGYGLMQSSFKTLLEALHERDFGVIIVDESHFLKNPKAVRTKTLIPLLTKAKRVLMLSGTPALARPAEVRLSGMILIWSH